MLFALACQPAPSTTASPESASGPAEGEDGWIYLFDGGSLDAWKTYGQDNVSGWEVRDGIMVALGQGEDIGGDLVTRDTFGDFELELDWQIGPGGNSGVLYRVVDDPDTYEAVYFTGPEYQLLDDSAYAAEVTPLQMTGANYGMHVAQGATANPPGEWNHTRIRVEGNQVTHWLNGKVVVQYELGTPEWEALVAAGKWKDYPDYGRARTGHIALQDHGHEARFRQVRIRRLGRSLFNGQDLSGWKIHGTEKWYVEEGDLVCESGPDAAYGYLATEEHFKDMDLEVEFLQESDGNSGVFFRSSLEGTKITGWQAEVAPPDHDTGGIYESYGRGWLVQIPEEKEGFLRMGEWNRLRVRVVGDRVQTWLNGEPMVDFTDEKIGQAEGVIALQIHDGGGIKVRWRNLRVVAY